MHSRDQKSDPIFITRHAIQFILHAAQDNAAGECNGLVGYSQPGVISHTTLLNDPVADSMASACKQWSEQQIPPCGTFFVAADTTIPDREELATRNSALRRACQPPSTDVIHLQVSLNTHGCLETQAFQLENDRVISIPLVLLEDGQTGRKG